MVYNKGGVVMGTAATPVRYSQVNMIKIRQSKQKHKQTNKNNNPKHGLQQGRGSYGYCSNTSAIFSGNHIQYETIKRKGHKDKKKDKNSMEYRGGYR